MTKAIVIFSGYNQRAIVAFMRILEKHNLEYAIIASSVHDPIFLTDYASKVTAVRAVATLDIVTIMDLLDQTKKKLSIDELLIAPSTEALNRFLLLHRAQLEEARIIIPIVSKEKYEQISDKSSFSKICVDHGIRIPEEKQLIDVIPTPSVAKPLSYFSKKGEILSPVLILDSADLEEFNRNYQPEDFYFQEYVNGESIYLLYFFYKDGRITKFSQKNLVQQPDGKSIVAALPSDFHLSPTSEQYEKLFLSIGYHGPVMVEIKVQDGVDYMIEANPRFWGPSQLFVDAGVGIFDGFLEDYDIITAIDQTKQTNIRENVRYFWNGGYVLGEKDKKGLVFHGVEKDVITSELPEWLSAEVYNRVDTLKLFNQEANI